MASVLFKVTRSRSFCHLKTFIRSSRSVECNGSFRRVAMPLRTISSNAASDPPIPQEGILTRFWKWLSHDELPTEVISLEEKEERDALLERVQDMYFANPPVEPDLAFYKETFTTLIKYNDRNAVDTLWHFMLEMKVQPDDEVSNLVQSFLERTKQSLWFD